VLFALMRFIKNPSAASAERLQNVIFLDGDRVRAQMGERMNALRDYQIERARQPSVNKANRVLVRTLGTKAIPDEELRSISVPVAMIWGRHDRVMKFKLAERASHSSDGRSIQSTTRVTSRWRSSRQHSERRCGRSSSSEPRYRSATLRPEPRRF
jgi:hypothetical protein